MSVEIVDVAEGLWLWRQPHPAGARAMTGSPQVGSFAVASRGVAVLLDPLAPPPSARAAWDRIEALAPDTIVVLKPDHVRDVDLFVRWYGARPTGRGCTGGRRPAHRAPPVRPGDELPGGLRALDDGRGAAETPVYLPEQRALVFADGHDGARRRAARVGTRRITSSARCRRCAGCSSCRSSSCWCPTASPFTTRADYEAALERPPF